MGERVPVLGTFHGRWTKNLPFFEFRTRAIEGLARVDGKGARRELHILAIASSTENRGHCGRFLAKCMNAYATITIWQVGHEKLRAMLLRRGFTITRAASVDGLEEVFTWQRTTQ